jgi:hypothetical protein
MVKSNLKPSNKNSTTHNTINNLAIKTEDNISNTSTLNFIELPFRFRLLLVFFILLLLLFHNHANFFSSDEIIGKCNIDKIFDLTKKLNEYMHNNETFRKTIVIISSFLIDLSIVSLAACWILYARSWRPLLTIGLFYSLRGTCNAIFMMKYPDNIIWEYPGFPALSIPYHMSSDFFFSGHVGINLIAALELNRSRFFKLSYISFFGVFFQLFTMIAVRGHYVIDLVAGLIAAHYCNLISFQLVHLFDNVINIDHKVNGFFFKKSEIIYDKDESEYELVSIRTDVKEE